MPAPVEPMIRRCQPWGLHYCPRGDCGVPIGPIPLLYPYPAPPIVAGARVVEVTGGVRGARINTPGPLAAEGQTLTGRIGTVTQSGGCGWPGCRYGADCVTVRFDDGRTTENRPAAMLRRVVIAADFGGEWRG
jgi:hypothetical protein